MEDVFVLVREQFRAHFIETVTITISIGVIVVSLFARRPQGKLADKLKLVAIFGIYQICRESNDGNGASGSK